IGLYLNVSRLDFLSSNPDPQVGGDLRRLNLPSLVDAECETACTFTRTLTDLMGGGEWTATAEGFPSGTIVTITPDRFDLLSSASRKINVQVDISNTGIIGNWVSGKIRLSTEGAADQFLTVSVQPSDAFDIVSDSNSGWKEFLLRYPDALSDATFSAGGLTPRDSRTELLVEDPTRDDPYDGGEGVFTAWYELPDGALWFFAETPASTSEDVDLFVGRDVNGNRIPEESEELCSSTTPEDLERCEFMDLPAGDYWIIVQNWDGNLIGGDDVTLLSAAVVVDEGAGLAASGPGIVAADEPFSLRLSWENVSALPGETWFGAVGVGTSRETPSDVGIVPVRFTRNGIAPVSTLPLMAGRDHGLALAGSDKHDRMFIDIPPGTESLTVQAAGADAMQSDNLSIDLVRLDFADAFSEPPFATPADGRPIVVSASGSADSGPVVTVDGGVEPGRWYPIVRNDGAQAAAVSIRAEVQQGGVAIDPMPGLWSPSSRPNEINQGFEFNWAEDPSSPHFLVWYTYDESGRPEWFFASANRNDQNVWTADLMRVTNDGAEQQLQRVGSVSLSLLATDDAMFSYTLYGESG
ncbi:MAG: hypothetical protein JJ992_29400, partial [Planctomycetes bacterium]|nr:hypothetical protein [Planctomycetota bacterium]